VQRSANTVIDARPGVVAVAPPLHIGTMRRMSIGELRLAETELGGVVFPDDYSDFVISSGRVDRDIGGSWLMLYGAGPTLHGSGMDSS